MGDLTRIQADLPTQIVGGAAADGTAPNYYMKVNVDGSINVARVDSYDVSYAAAIRGLGVAIAATDIFTLTGSATKTVKITKMHISADQSTASTADVALIKRSTANSGGTSSILTNVPYDSTNAAATATVRAYTANPTLGTTVGSLRNDKLVITAGTTGGSFVGAINILVYVFGDSISQPIVLNGTSEVFSVNLNGGTFTGSSFDISIEWTEE